MIMSLEKTRCGHEPIQLLSRGRSYVGPPAPKGKAFMKNWNLVKPATLVAAALVLCLTVAQSMRADEGMWTFDNFPSKAVGTKYGFTPSQAWLDHVRLASLRIAGGCSASFVSPQGLVMTNHHCVDRMRGRAFHAGAEFRRKTGMRRRRWPRRRSVRRLSWTSWLRFAM